MKINLILPSESFALPECSRRKILTRRYFCKNAIEAAIISLAARISLRAGYDSDARGLLLTHRVHRTEEIKEVHQIDYYLKMVKALGCVPIDREMHLEVKINPLDAQDILRKFILDTEKTIIGIAPGATYGPAKRWLPDRFAALADKLNEHLASQVIILGGKADLEVAQEVQRLAQTKIINLAGKTTLRESIYLIPNAIYSSAMIPG